MRHARHPQPWGLSMPFLNRFAPQPDAPDPDGVTVSAAQVRAAKFAANLATASLVYFLWLYTLDLARDRAGAMHVTHAGGWVGDFTFWFPYIIGFAIVAFGIPYVAKIAIPTFMALDWRTGFWPKLWALGIAAAVSVVIISGTFAVQGDTILERDRGAAIAVQQVEQGAAVLAAQIADVQHAMDERTRSESAYVRTAASMSPEAYDRFVESRRGDWQYDRLVSYRAVSEEMERLNARMSALRVQQASQQGTAAVARRVEGNGGTSWIGGVLDWLEGVRAILLSLVMDIVCLMMPWIARHLELRRNAQLALAGEQESAASGVDEAHMIPDLRAQPPVEAQPWERRQKIVDAETGDELIAVAGAKPHLRRKKKRVQTAAGAHETQGALEERVTASPSDARRADQPIITGDEPLELTQAIAETESGVAPTDDGESEQERVQEFSDDDLALLADDDIILADGAGVMKRDDVDEDQLQAAE